MRRRQPGGRSRNERLRLHHNNGWRGILEQGAWPEVAPITQIYRKPDRSGYISLPGGSRKESKDGRDNSNNASVMFALLEKFSHSVWDFLHRKTIQNTNGDMKDGPIILPHAAMKEKLTKCNLIVGGTHSANRVCLSNPTLIWKMYSSVSERWLTAGTGTIWAPPATAAQK